MLLRTVQLCCWLALLSAVSLQHTQPQHTAPEGTTVHEVSSCKIGESDNQVRTESEKVSMVTQVIQGEEVISMVTQGNELTTSKAKVQFMTMTPRQTDIYNLLVNMHNYLYIVIGVVGMLGNVLNILVLYRQNQALSPYTYLSALASCDLGSSVCLLWMGCIAHQSLQQASHTARLLYFYTMYPVFGLNEGFATAAGLLATVLSVDRLIAVRFPLHRTRWCTVRRARWLSALVVVFSILVNVHYPLRINMHWVWDDSQGLFMPQAKYTELAHNKSMNDFARYSAFLLKMVLPFGVMSITNSLTLASIHKSRKFRIKVGSVHKKDEESIQCTAITIGVVMAFFVSQSPRAAYYLDSLIFGMAHRGSFAMETFILVGMVLAWSNTNINFYIYCALSRRFQQQVVVAVVCCCRAAAVEEDRSRSRVSTVASLQTTVVQSTV